jgi:hypothetical protein
MDLQEKMVMTAYEDGFRAGQRHAVQEIRSLIRILRNDPEATDADEVLSYLEDMYGE